MRRITLAGLFAVTVLGLAGAAPAAVDGGEVAANDKPLWVKTQGAVVPGQPATLILDGGAARVCWVTLRGGSHRPVTWRFEPNGLRLVLTLLTRADAKAAQWRLTATCARGGTKASATTTIHVPPNANSGTLATHSDMRVELMTNIDSTPPTRRTIIAGKLVTRAGGVVKAPNGVAIRIPARVLTRNSLVSIIDLGRGRYDIKIDGSWRGRVAVTLPLRGKSDAILHRVGGVWVPEGTQRGKETVWVSQLSWFTSLSAKTAQALCLSWSAKQILACLVKKGVKYVNKQLAEWLAKQISDSCVAAVLASAPFGAGAVFLTVFFEPACAGGVAEAPVDVTRYRGHVVQWDGDTKAQKTSWLVTGDLRRNWIPDTATFNCLRDRGTPGPVVLSSSALNRLPDQIGVHASCTPPGGGGGPPPGDGSPPSPPSNLAVSNVTHNSLRLTWSPSTDNVGVTGYNVYLDGSFVATVGVLVADYLGRACGTTYTLGVAARDAAGNVSGRSSITGRTSDCTGPPPPPATVSLSKGASAQGRPGCSSSACRYLAISWANFHGGSHTVVCRASSGDEGGFYTYTVSGGSGSSAVCYYGFPGRTAWVTVDGVESNRVSW